MTGQNKFQFYVTDWTPSGVNSLYVIDSEMDRVIDHLSDVCFGIDVNRLEQDSIFVDDVECWPVSVDIVKSHVTDSPVPDTYKENCKALSKYLEG